MNVTHRLTAIGALTCLSALAVGCATSNDNSPIVPPPETASVEAGIDPSAIESPPWALPETGDLPPDPVATNAPIAVADDAAPAVDSSDLTREPTPSGKKKDTQFQMLTQNFGVGGDSYRVSIKLDRHSGQTWRLDPESISWIPIAEASGSAALVPATSARYGLQVQRDEASNSPTETFMRMDLTTGDAWLYTKQQGAWKSLAP